MKFSLLVLSLFISPEVFARPSAGNHNVGKLRISRSPKRQGRVMGGEEADIEDYPYAVSLKYKKRDRSKQFQHYCGGTLVNSLNIITAAHCVMDKNSGKILRSRDFRVEVGVQDTRNTNDKRTYRVDSIMVHPKYSTSRNRGIDHDLALIKLQEPVKFTDFAQPINLFESNEVPTTNGIIVGWGEDQWRGKPTHVLNMAEVPIRSNAECKEMLNTVESRDGHKKTYKNGKIVFIREGHLCAGYDKGGTDGCQGDSGAGLVTRYKGHMELVGIMSAGSACGRPFKPGVYTRVSEYRDWITANTQ